MARTQQNLTVRKVRHASYIASERRYINADVVYGEDLEELEGEGSEYPDHVPASVAMMRP